MKIIRSPDSMLRQAQLWRRQGKPIGLVPTMGAFHEGHISLIQRSVRECEQTVVSIYVNPLQFGSKKDYRCYPRSPNEDMELARKAGASVVFLPSPRQMCPPDAQTRVRVGTLTQNWEGACRPGHFEGVTTIVAQLFCLTLPSIAYFGQKDYQQLLVIQRMVEDLNFGVVIRKCRTLRDTDGLALSSRNRYLSGAQRQRAVGLYACLRAARRAIRQGQRNDHSLRTLMKQVLSEYGVRHIDYVGITDAKSLVPAKGRLKGNVVLLVAVRLGRTRLIDNLLVRVS